jgi:hypothetical protein
MRAVFPETPRTPRTLRIPAIPNRATRRTDRGARAISATSMDPAARAPATRKQAPGGGTSVVPTTASARSRRVRKGRADPQPHATCRIASTAKDALVNLTVNRMSGEYCVIAGSERGNGSTGRHFEFVHRCISTVGEDLGAGMKFLVSAEPGLRRLLPLTRLRCVSPVTRPSTRAGCS